MTYQHGIVILDRDGVINEDSDDYIKSADEWLPIDGSLEAISRLSKQGILVGVATNQSGLARGLFDEYKLAQMHQKFHTLLEELGGQVAAICYCPHAPDADCRCRKPGTGLLEQLSEELNSPLQGAAFIGDSLKDLQAARKFDMQPILVRTGKGRITEQKLDTDWVDVPVFDNLSAAVDALLDHT